MLPGAPFARCGLILVLSFGSARAADDDPDSMWVGAYAWLQAGEKLEEAGATPLALGSLIEAQEQMEDLRDRHPEFEPEIVSYRVEALGTDIAILQRQLGEGEEAIMSRYLEFIQSYEKGMQERFSGEFSDSLDTLNEAKVLLDQIIYERPDQYRDAVDTLYELLHSSIAWLEEQLSNKRRRRTSAYVSDDVEWGTTQYIKPSDLPADGDTVLTSGDLFPALPSPEEIADLKTIPGSSHPESSDSGESSKPEDSEEPEDLPGFRMNSRQQSIPKLPSGEDESVAPDE